MRHAFLPHERRSWESVRAAVVKVISKSGRPATMKRPIQRLFPLEYLIDVKQPQEEQSIEGVRPPRRLAAQNADCTDQ